MNVNRKGLGRLSWCVASIIIIITIPATMSAMVRIGGKSLRANGQIAQNFDYSGSCPVNLQFGWGVVSTEPGILNYSFVRSDGVHTSMFARRLPGGDRSLPIYTDWHIGGNNPEFANYSGWVELNIESPNRASERIMFTVRCGSPGGYGVAPGNSRFSAAGGSVRIGGFSMRANGQIAEGFQYTGACPARLEFTWGVIASEPTAINYVVTCSDGATSRSFTTSLQGGRSTPIRYDWFLGANRQKFAEYSGWVQMNISSPTAVEQKIPFTVHCQ